MRVLKLYFASVCLLASLSLLEGATEASLAVKTGQPGNVYTTKKELIFSLDKNIKTDDIEYEVKDWQKNSVAKGIWKNPETDSLKLETLPRGYYTMTLKSSSQEFSGYVPFSVVTDPSERTVNYDGFFALNVMQTCLSRKDTSNKRQPEKPLEVTADLALLSGGSMFRDMSYWQLILKKPDTWDWNAMEATHISKLIADRGLRSCMMFEKAPDWSKKTSKDLPDDLFALYDFTSKACVSPTYKANAYAWEFWNEEDIESYCSDPAWDFAACQKAAYLGFKSANPDIKVLNGSLCQNPPTGFVYKLFDNGMADYFDVFNYHTYSPFMQYDKLLSDIKSILAKYNAADKPIWFTENGSDYEGLGKLDSYMPYRARKGDEGKPVIPFRKEHDSDQELIIAEFIPKAQIRMQSLGVAKNFFFVLSPHNERGCTKSWGLLRYDYTAKPAFTSYSTLTSQLSNAKYLGRYSTDAGVQAYLYEQSNGTQTLAVWSESELDTINARNPQIDVNNRFEKKITIKIPERNLFARLLDMNEDYTLTDMLGKNSPLKADNNELTLTVNRFPCYISKLKGLSATATFYEAKKSARENIDKTIVIKATLSQDFTIPSKTMAALEKNKGSLSLDIYNFSDEIKKGTLAFTGKGKLNIKQEEFVIQPMQKVTVEAEFIPDSVLSDFTVQGIFNGKKTSRLQIPVLASVFVEKSMDIKKLSAESPERWRKNSSGDMQFSYDASEKAVKVNVKFDAAKNDYWAYPEFVLKDDETLKNACGVSFEIKALQGENSTVFPHSNFMAVTENIKETGKGAWLPYKKPSKEWQKIFIPLSQDLPEGMKAEDIKLLRIGMGAINPNLSFWIRNLTVYYNK